MLASLTELQQKSPEPSGTSDPGEGLVARYQHTLNGSVSAVSKPMFASRYLLGNLLPLTIE